MARVVGRHPQLKFRALRLVKVRDAAQARASAAAREAEKWVGCAESDLRRQSDAGITNAMARV